MGRAPSNKEGVPSDRTGGYARTASWRSSIAPSIDHGRDPDGSSVYGLALFLEGLLRKAVIADNCALIAMRLSTETWAGQISW